MKLHSETTVSRWIWSYTQKQQSAGEYEATLRNIIFITSQQVLFFLLNAVCVVEKQQIPIL
jgi:hypothetical protein